MGVHRQQNLQRGRWWWITPTNISHFCCSKLFLKLLYTKRKIQWSSLSFTVLSILFILCNNHLQYSESLAITSGNASSSSSAILQQISPIGTGIIQGFLKLNSSSQVSSSTLSSILTGDDNVFYSSSTSSPPVSSLPVSSTLPFPSFTPTTESLFVPNNNNNESRFRSSIEDITGDKVFSKVGRKDNNNHHHGIIFSSEASGMSPSSAENRRRIKQYIPESLFAQRHSKQGQRQIRDRARFLVGSLSRQNCFSKVICGLGARPPSTKTDLLNDYVYLMNELLTEDEEKSLEQGKGAKVKTAAKEIEAKNSKKKKTSSFSLFTRDESDEDEKPPIPTASDDDDYNPVLAQIADEELILDDPAILKFMELERKKKDKLRTRFRGGGSPFGYGGQMPRYPRSLSEENNNQSNASNTTTTPRPSTVPPAKIEGRSSRRQTYREGPRYFRSPSEMNMGQFLSKRRLELRNEKDFKKRLNLAADTGRTLGIRNRRQCRLLFDDCPLDDKQIDSLVVGLRRVMESGGNIAALVPPTTTAQPAAVQAAVNAMEKTAQAAAAASQPGSKVEIILHLNQNGMPYNPQQNGATYPATTFINPNQQQPQQQQQQYAPLPSQIPPPTQGSLPMSPYQHHPPTAHAPMAVPPTTPRPVAEEQLLDFLYGVVNFNSTTESPQQDEDNYDWLSGDTPHVSRVKDKMKEKDKPPVSMVASIDDYLETPLKVRDRNKPLSSLKDPPKIDLDKIFDNLAAADAEDAPLPEGSDGEINALKDYLSSLKETLLGLYQMNNASLAVESDFFAGGKSSEESKESKEEDDITRESEDRDFFEISGGKKKKKKGSKNKDKDESEEYDDDTEVLLKLKGTKKKKKGGSTTTERYDPVDDEVDREEDADKIFDDDQTDNEAPKPPAGKKPVRKRPQGPPSQKRPAPGQSAQKNKKPVESKKKPAFDDEDEVKEAPLDQVEDGEDEEDDDEEYEDDEEGSDEDENNGGEEEDEDEDEDDDDEDEEEEEGRQTNGSKGSSPSSSSKTPNGAVGLGPKKPGAPKPDPTKITLIFAPSGSGPDKVGSVADVSDLNSEERKKLAALTEVLLPTAPAPSPLSPKKPIQDPDEKPVVPAARPVHREFEKVGSFTKGTKIVNISDFGEDSPKHPAFHKKFKKKRPSYRNPVAKKKKNQQQQDAVGYQRPPLGRPVGALPPPPFRPPSYRPRPSGKPASDGASAEEEAQDDDAAAGEGGGSGGVSGEGNSSEEGNRDEDDQEYGDRDHGDDYHGDRDHDEQYDGDEDRDEDDGPYDDEPKKEADKGADKKKEGNKAKPENDKDEEDRDDDLIEFGPGRVPLPGPGPPGIGRLPPKPRDDISSSGGSEESEGHGQTQTLIAVPYFRQNMETKFAEGAPSPELVSTGNIAAGSPGANGFLGNFFNMMGMNQGGESSHGGGDGHPPHHHHHHMPPYFGRPPAHMVSFEDGRTPHHQSESLESQTLNSGNKTPHSSKYNSSAPLIIGLKGDKDDLADDVPQRQFKATINVDTTVNGAGDDEYQPEFDIDEPQDDKKGKKKKKKKKKKTKKRKRKRKRKKGHGSALISQMHWTAGTPSLFVEGDGIEPVLTELKKYVTSITGNLLYLPPDLTKRQPVLLGDNPPGFNPHADDHHVQPPVTPHFPVPIYGGWDDDDSSSSEEKCKGGKKKKGKKKKKKKKKGRRREARKKKKKKKKKKKGNKDDSCEASYSEEYSGEEDKKDGDKKGGDGDKKDGDKKATDISTREDLKFLAGLLADGPLLIDPTREAVTKASTTTRSTTTRKPWWRTTTESGRSGVRKSTIAPTPSRYKITKRPRTPRPQFGKGRTTTTVEPTVTPKPEEEEEIEDFLLGGRKPSTRPPLPPMKGNIGQPIMLWEATTERSRWTTPKPDLTTQKSSVPKPTRKRLQYKRPGGSGTSGNNNKSRRPAYTSVAKGPMVGTVYSSLLSTTTRPRPKEDDEQEPADVHFQPMPGGLHIRNRPPPHIDTFHEHSAELLGEGESGDEKYLDDQYQDEYSESNERQGRRPPLDVDGEKRPPYRHSLRYQQQRLGAQHKYHRAPTPGGSIENNNSDRNAEISLPSSVLLPGGVRGYNNAKEDEEQDGEEDRATGEKNSRGGASTPSTSSPRGSKGARKRNSSSRPHPQRQQQKTVLPPPPPPHFVGPPETSQTTGLAAIKNFNIRNFLSRYGNNLLDKTMAAYNNGR